MSALDIASKSFPEITNEEYARFFLMEYTAFPFGDRETWESQLSYIKRNLDEGEADYYEALKGWTKES